MWLICQTTLGRGKNKLLVRGVNGAEWVFCPMFKSIKRGRVSTDRCKGCKHFIRFEQTCIPQACITRKTFFFGTLDSKEASNITRIVSKRKTVHSRPALFPYIPSLTEERQPLVDVFEEEDHLTVLVELPGVDKKDLHIEADEKALIITASSKTKDYLRKVWLPASIRKDKIKFAYRNNILQIRLKKLCSKV